MHTKSGAKDSQCITSTVLNIWIYPTSYTAPLPTMDLTMQQRREEILAKKAKLAELKKQREIRKEQMAQRQSMGSPFPEVWSNL